MKSLVCNVFGMALGVACLALCLQHCSFADDQPAPPEQKQEQKQEQTQTQVQEQVVFFQSDDGKSAEVQKQVIVVTTDDEKADAADTLKKALHRRLEKLPAEIQEKIKHKLQAAKEARDAKQKEVQVEVIAVGSDGEVGTTEQSASQTQQTTTVVAKAFPEGAEKHVTIAVDGKELSGDDQGKTFTVTMKDGQVVVNDKPVDAPGLDCVKCGTITLVVKADAETGAVKTEVKKDDDQAPKAECRMFKILTGDGQSKTFNFDVDSNVHGMVLGEAHMQLEGVAEAATAKEGTYTFTIVGDNDGKSAEGVHKIQMHAVKAKAAEGEPAVGVITVTPSTGMPHGALMHPAMPGAKVHADFAKQLKDIESELKQIRKLLEKMQKEDADK